MKLTAIQADITTLKLDAIVNAVKPSLLGGGGVDGAIHRAAGPELLNECRKLGGCGIGDAKITSAYDLPAKFVIHTVGPVYHGREDEAHTLYQCYMRSLQVGYICDCKTIAFPCISTGIYGYPLVEAAKIAIDAVTHWGELYLFDEAIFCCFSAEDLAVYEKLLAEGSDEND
jgi:O-acetyl-ADP-ribose deacetylase (regulator of RNase III)